MPRTISSTPRGSRTPGRVSLSWVIAVFGASFALVACIILGAAWVLGGRAAPTTPTVTELLPPEPRQSPNVTADSEVATVSALHAPAGTDEEYLVGEAAAILPGALKSTEVKELPVDRISDLKPLGWAVPYLDREGFQHDYVETSSVESVRTIQVRLTDGTSFINVAETRPEAEKVELYPLHEKLHSVVNLDAVTAETLELTTGQEATLYREEEAETWTTAVETSSVQYVITSSLPHHRASEITSWVMITDRSRVQLAPNVPGPADRLERGFDEIFGWFAD
ncbi:hypothetical protein [Nesterenkonia ebinurensis]|uniref:hypothetical protein n=1 Tax=Nesterenkonia ebinurensis TaxID=2608252 RepID=UPI00123DCEB6|nr:hypothetical protein [Nesterenkonia ebinurensis]